MNVQNPGCVPTFLVPLILRGSLEACGLMRKISVPFWAQPSNSGAAAW